MCRILIVRDSSPFSISSLLPRFAAVARNSTEFQGDGWGCCWLQEHTWKRYRNPGPIWNDNLTGFGETNLLIVHARSAFRNEDLGLENNMPFIDGNAAFAFNGELRGVRLQADGGIGAEKLFRFIMRCTPEITRDGLRKVVGIIKRRTRYVRAMNFAVALPGAIAVHSFYSETPEYFTLHKKVDRTRTLFCSDPFPGDRGWTRLPNDYLEVHSF